MRHLMYCLCCLLFFGFCYSQNLITGTVFTSDLAPVKGCHIHIGPKSTSSNPKGDYLLKDVPNGAVKLAVYCEGYQSIDSTILVNGNMKLNFQLKKKITELNQVVVKHKVNKYNKSILEHKIKSETIEKYSNQTLGEAMKEVAGVSLLKTGTSIMKPIINGLHSSRVPVMTNGVRLEDQQWGSEHAPNFDVNSAAKITVLKGSSALQYSGDAIGGMVIIEPLIVEKDTLFGKTLLSLASNGRGGTLSTSLHKGNSEKWSWNALATFKYFGDRNSPDYVLSNTGNQELDFTGDITYTGKNYDFSAFYSLYNTSIGILSASHSGNVNDLYNSINNQVPSIIRDFTYDIINPKQEVQHHIGKLHYHYFFNETASMAIQYAFQFNKRLEYDVRRQNFKDIPALDLQLQTHTINVDFDKEYHDWDFKSGATGTFQNNFANPSTGVRPLIPSYDKVDFGLYGVASHNFYETLIFDTGIRYDFSSIDATKWYQESRWIERDYSPEFDRFIVEMDGNRILTNPEFAYHNLSLSAGIHKKWKKEWDLYFNLSWSSRNPNPAELFSDGLHHSTGVIELGDLRMQKEQSFKAAATVQKRWSGFSANLNPFVNSINNYMFLRPVGFETTIRGAFPVYEYQQTNALLTGADLETNWNINKNWQHQLAFAYVYGRDISNDEALIDMPPLNLNNTIRFTKKEWNHLLLELKSELVSRQNRYPDNNFTTLIVEDGELTPVEVDISTPPDAYHLLHFYSEVKLNTFKGTNTVIAFSVQNIFNTAYRDYLNRQRFFADEMGRNFQIQLKINY